MEPLSTVLSFNSEMIVFCPYAACKIFSYDYYKLANLTNFFLSKGIYITTGFESYQIELTISSF